MKRLDLASWKPLITIIITSLLVISIKTGTISAQEKIIDRKKLVSVTMSKGFVKVIIQLEVPKIRELTGVSTKYKNIEPGLIFPRDGIKADIALEAAISEVAYAVSTRLRSADALYKINHTYTLVPIVALEVSEKALSILEMDPSIIRIVEDRLVPLVDVRSYKKGPVDVVPPSLYDSVSIIGVDNAWAAGTTGLDWYVAVLDTGIRSSHEFFSGKTIIEACFSAGEDCPNGLTEMYGPGAATHYENSYNGWDHGTHVAGIATGNNGSTLYGVAKDADIIAIQVFSRFTADECDGENPCVMSYTSDQIKGLEYVYSLRGTYSIASSNMSLGGDHYSDQITCDEENASIKSAIDNLRSVGIATVIASGNDGYCDGINAPGCISSAVAVGATTKSDQETWFNNWHESMLDLFTPGQTIYSSTGDSNTSYEYWSGTSMATPHVAGAWAILKQKSPSETVSAILNSLSTTGVSVTTLCTGQPGSKPRIQVDAALTALSCQNLPLKIDTQYFDTIQMAYDSAAEENTIQIRSVEFTEDVALDRNITATLKGGYDCDYTANLGYTTVNGLLTISNGTVIIENLVIK